MRGVYTAVAQATGITTGATLIYITVPSNKVVEILSASITNSNNVVNQQLEAVLQTVNSLGTPTASTLTPTPQERGDQAAGSTVKGPVTASEPSYLSNTQMGLRGFPSLGGYFYEPTPEERPIVAGGATIGLRLLTSSPTSFNADATITFRELG